MSSETMLAPLNGASPAVCHLVEITAMPDVRYSLILGSLQASAQVDPTVASSYRFSKHVLFQDPGLMERLPAWTAGLEPPDVVALSVYFWNRTAVMTVAREVKRLWPQCLVVLGGNDVSYQTESVFGEPAVDVLVHGEGEITFRNLLRALAEPEGDLRTVNGISYRDGEQVVTTTAATRIMDLAELPSPILSGVYGDDAIATSRTIIMETNRGCPYSCAFCYWGGATKSKVRAFPLERVKAEISHVVEHAPQNATLFLADANFGILPRDVEIAEWLVSELKRHNKQMFLYTNWAKNTNKRVMEAARILYSHRLIAAVTLSAQSFTPEVLQIANRSNIRTSYYRTLQREFQEHGIPTYTELIWGLPGETLQTHLDSVEEAIEAGGHPVVYPLLLLNNTEYTRDTFRDEHGLLTRFLPYQVANPEMQAEFVIGHERMTTDDWQAGLDIRLAGAVFYNCLLRSLLHYLHLRTGVRIVDLYARLVAYLDDVCSDEVIRRLTANQRVTWSDPSALDMGLIRTLVRDDAIPEHLHYQAIMQRLAQQGTAGLIAREAAEYLYDGLDPAAAPAREEFEAVLAFQSDVAESIADCVRGEIRTRASRLPADVHTLLEEAGQASSGIPDDTHVRLELDSAALAGTPADTMLLAIYHGSVRLPRALQPAHVPA
jgi:radical SAM superfamily enzyme YgiQ (UPF0313 family)